MVSATPSRLFHCSVKGNVVGPPFSWIPHPRIQPITDLKYSQKNSRKFQKAKLEFTAHWQLFTWHLHYIYNYLHIIYIVLGIISNLEMI